MDAVKDILEEKAIKILESITDDEIKNVDAVRKKIDAAIGLIESERQLIKDDREHYESINRRDEEIELEHEKLKESKRQFKTQIGVTIGTFIVGLASKFGLGAMVNRFERENFYSKTPGKNWARDIFKEVKIKWW